MKGPTVLIIDDELQIRRFLRIGLEAEGYNVVEAATGKDGIYQAAVSREVVIILDLGLPDMDGQKVLHQVRQWNSVPILILSVRNDESEKIACFDNGADDYIVKPFSMGEFMARMRSALRRAQKNLDDPVFRNGSLCIDFAKRLVTVDERYVQLSPTEYDLLKLFACQSGKVLTHRQIMQEIWGPFYEKESQSLRVFIRLLRKKLEVDPGHPTLIMTIPGVGYRMPICTPEKKSGKVDTVVDTGVVE
jgi:two-component system, OmpR family, KDP operon response regulator KdpE